MEIKLSEIQLSKLKIMYGTKFKKYKGLYIITTSKNSCDIICENGLIRDVSSIGKVYGEYLLINKGGIGRLANLKTGKVSKRFYDEGLAEANEYLIIDSIERKSASTTYHKVYVVDRESTIISIEYALKKAIMMGEQKCINLVLEENRLSTELTIELFNAAADNEVSRSSMSARGFEVNIKEWVNGDNRQRD